MTKLSVNINKIATLRNARGGNLPNVLSVAKDCENLGAQGITVHPRPDQRHITYQDVKDLSIQVSTEFNVEGYPSESFINLISEVVPHQVTLVPDKPNAITSDTGWNFNNQEHISILSKSVGILRKKKIRSVVFVNADGFSIQCAAKLGFDRVELYTGPYAEMYTIKKEKAIISYRKCSLVAEELNIGLNAGHDLSLDNLHFFSQKIPNLKEVSIGHALICDAIYYGLEKTIYLYKKALINDK